MVQDRQSLAALRLVHAPTRLPSGVCDVDRTPNILASKAEFAKDHPRYRFQIPPTTLFLFHPTVWSAACATTDEVLSCPHGFTPSIGLFFSLAPVISFLIHLLWFTYMPVGMTTTWLRAIFL